MPLCENPECGKEIREGQAYCNGDCLRRHLELKKLDRREMNLAQEEDIWPGQRRRKNTMDVISRLAKELCPMPQGRFVSLVSYRTGLSRRKVAEDYLVILLDVGLLKVNEGTLHLAEELAKGEL